MVNHLLLRIYGQNNHIKKGWEKQIELHELRTPISIIQTNLEAVMDEPNATIQEQMRWLKNIPYETLQMPKLVDHLLTLSRSAGVQKTLNKTTFALDKSFNCKIDCR